ncbi:MAG: ATP-binding protein [Bacteroidota bacterium]
MIKRISIIGPESTGKSTLAQQLAAHFGTVHVPEFAREYLEQLDRPYNRGDLETIARGQMALEDARAREAHRFLFCDTDLIVIKVWADYKYGTCPDWIAQRLIHRPHHHYLLCNIDLPWEADVQRENPEEADRQRLLRMYERELISHGFPHDRISGQGAERFASALAALNDL